MHFEDRNPVQIHSPDLQRFERRLGLVLPEDYKAFLLLNNGGRTTLYVLRAGNVGPVIVNDFFGLDPGSPLDLDDNVLSYKGRVPAGFLPFANDPGGNVFLLALADENRGSVFFWDHEREPQEEGLHWRDYPNLYSLSDSFTDFLGMLEHDD